MLYYQDNLPSILGLANRLGLVLGSLNIKDSLGSTISYEHTKKDIQWNITIILKTMQQTSVHTGIIDFPCSHITCKCTLGDNLWTLSSHYF